MTLAEKVITIADNTQPVCEAVKGAKLDVSGVVVSVGDVSSVEHSVGVRLTSKNLFNLQGREVVNFGEIPNTTKRVFQGGKGIILGFARTNYCFNNTTAPYTITDNSVSYTCLDDYYGIGFDIKLLPNTTYIASFADRQGILYLTEYDKDGSYIQTQSLAGGAITTNPNTDWGVVSSSNAKGTTVGFTDLQLELGTTATPYVPPVTDFSSVRLACSGGEDLFNDEVLLQASGWKVVDGVYQGSTGQLFSSFALAYGGFPLDYVFKPNTVYTLSCTARFVKQSVDNEKAVGFIFYYTDGTTEDRLYVTGRADFVTQSLTSNPNKSVTKIIATYSAEGTLYLKDVRLTEGIPTTYTYTANADGTVDGVRSLSPSMVLTTDNGGAVINARYFPVDAEQKQIAYAELKQEMKNLSDNLAEGRGG